MILAIEDAGGIFSLLVQAGGAVCVCGLFIWYLRGLRASDKEREALFFDQFDKQTAYLRERDAQSKEIAMSGHSALRDLTTELAHMREEMSRLGRVG